jgi:CBS-domain-containing membrane protein
MNTVRALTASHGLAATSGLATFLLLGHGYPAAAAALVTTILLMVLLDVVHPPAVSTTLTFALRSGAENDFVLFGVALALIIALVVLQRVGTWLLPRLTATRE